MSNESFKRDSDRVVRQIQQVKNDLSRRDQLASEGRMTRMVDGEIRGSMSSLESQLDVMKGQVAAFEANPKKYNLLAREVQRRKNVVLDLVNQTNNLKLKVQQQPRPAMKDNLLVRSQSVQEKKEALNRMNNTELVSEQNKLQAEQDEQLDTAQEKLVRIRHVGNEMGLTIQEQNVHLDSINLETDKTTREMSRLNSKLKTVLEKTSTCGLMVFIAVEVLTLILLIVLL